MKNVLLGEMPLLFLGFSAIEVYDRETFGFLVGSDLLYREEDVVQVEGAYPLQTAERGEGWSTYGNMAALDRTLGTMALMDGKRVLGGYHSHPGKSTYISEGDADHIEDEFRRFRKYRMTHGMGPDTWLEIVMGIKKREYTDPHEPDIRLREYARRIGIKVKPDMRGEAKCGFDITMGAHWLFREDGKFWKKEVGIYLPEAAGGLLTPESP